MSAHPSNGGVTPQILLISVILVLMWGTAFTMITAGLAYMSPLWMVALRTCLAAVLVTAYVYVRGRRLPAITDKRWLWYAGLGFSGIAFPFFLTASAQTVVDSGISAILTATMPLLTIILAHFFTDEHITPRKILGFVIGFIGIIILFLPEDFSFSLIGHWQYQLLIIAAATCYAITTVAAKRAPETASSVGAAMMVICAAIMTTGMAVLTEPSPFPMALPGWMVIAGLGIGSTAAGTILYLYVIQEAGASYIAKVNYFVPVASVVAGAWFLKEPFTVRIALAFGVILLGVIISGSRAIRPSVSE